jgi:serine/threonine protein kinase
MTSGEPGTSTTTDADQAQLPAAFGPYLLLHRIARGGMGNVFLAKTGGSMGIEKHCVVKTLREGFSADAEYVERFVEEARVVVQLSHRNICQVFDVGRVGGVYYLAMELVLGRDVRTVLTRLAERGRPLSPALAVYVVAEMLDALDYAHRHVDPVTGQPLHLVHRDVSPQNVLLNFEGEVKLIDFGLAETGRAPAVESTSTGSQSVMGKIAYMAPEQARGEIVDARADQFSAAVVAYELFAGSRYYGRLSQKEVWLQSGTGTFVPPGLKDLDDGLRAILGRALSPDRLARYPTCGDFRDALLAWSAGRGLLPGGRELRALMGEIFAAELEETRELLRRAAHLSSLPRPGFATVDAVGASRDVFSIATSTHSSAVPDPTEMIRRSDPAFAHAPPARRPVAALVAGLAIAATAVVAVVVLTRSPPPPPAVTTTTTTEPVAPPPVVPPPPLAPPAAPAPPPAADPPPSPPPVAPSRPVKKRPTTSPGALTITQKMAVLKRCKQPCAPPLAGWEGRLDAHPDVGAFKNAVDACVKTCGGG